MWGAVFLVAQRMDVVMMYCNAILFFELLLGFLLGCLAVLSVLQISHFRAVSVTQGHS